MGSELSEIVFGKYSRDGYMTFADFSTFCRIKGYLDEDIDESMLDVAFRRLDTDRSGTISYDEFWEWWKSPNRRESLQLESPPAEQLVSDDVHKCFSSATGAQVLLDCYQRDWVLSGAELKELVHNLEKNGPNRAAFNDSLAWLVDLKDKRLARVQCQDGESQADFLYQVIKYFKFFDPELRGTLNYEQFELVYNDIVVRSVWHQIPALHECFVQADTNCDGVICLVEFLSWYCSTE